ncbi:MAG: preprotein translocase subunit YajC [Clostridia bacterium]|nr:preprotein translocase subunit YajC [Clostridia bacterium]
MNLDWLFGISSALADELPTEVPVLEPTATPIPGTEVSPVLAGLIQFFPLILMGVVFYFFLIRPQRKKDKKVKEMLAALKPGDRVTTIGGIYGTIVSVKDETITLSIGSQRTEMVVTRWAIRQVEEVSVENDGEILA